MASAFSMLVTDKPDAKLCMELGACILLDKPIVVLVPPGTQASANLKRCAAAIVEGSMDDPATQEKLTAAVKAVVANDNRIKKPV